MTRLIAPHPGLHLRRDLGRHEARPGADTESVLFNDMPGDNAFASGRGRPGTLGEAGPWSATR